MLQQGSHAPYAGILMPATVAARMVADRERLIESHKLDLESAQDSHLADLEALDSRWRFDMVAVASERDALEAALADATDPPWYRQPAVVLFVGFAAGAATTIGVLYATNSR